MSVNVKIYRLWSDQPGYGWDMYQEGHCVGSSSAQRGQHGQLREYNTPYRAQQAAERYVKRWGYGRIDKIVVEEQP